MSAQDARAAIRTLGEFAHGAIVAGQAELTFVKYDPGVRSGKFHTYKKLVVPLAVYQEIKHELK